MGNFLNVGKNFLILGRFFSGQFLINSGQKNPEIDYFWAYFFHIFSITTDIKLRIKLQRLQ